MKRTLLQGPFSVIKLSKRGDGDHWDYNFIAETGHAGAISRLLRLIVSRKAWPTNKGKKTPQGVIDLASRHLQSKFGLTNLARARVPRHAKPAPIYENFMGKPELQGFKAPLREVSLFTPLWLKSLISTNKILERHTEDLPSDLRKVGQIESLLDFISYFGFNYSPTDIKQSGKTCTFYICKFELADYRKFR